VTLHNNRPGRKFNNMPGPWEDFQTNKVNTTDGPWKDFSSSGGPWEDFQNGDAQKMGTTKPGIISRGLSALGHGIQKVENAVAPLTKPLLNIFQDDPGLNVQQFGAVANRSRIPDVYGPAVTGVVVPGIGLGIVPINTQAGGIQRPPSNVPLPAAMVPPGRLLKTVADVANPLNVGLAVGTAGTGELAPMVAKGLGILYGTEMAAKQLPEQLGELSVNPTPENISDAAITAAMLGGIGKGIMPEAPVPPTGALPTENPSGAAALLERSNPRVIPPSGKVIPLPRQFPEITDLQFIPKRFEETPPSIGQRPLTIEQPILPPVEAQPQGKVVIPELPSAPRTTPLAGQISFEGQGIPSAGQTASMVPENVMKSRDQLSGTKMYSGLGDFDRYQKLTKLLGVALRKGDFNEFARLQQEVEDIKNRQPIKGMPPVKPGDQATVRDLRPAVEVGGKVLVGEQGDSHADILIRNGIDPESIPHEDPRRGFASVSNPTKLINRQDAEKITGMKGTAKAGGLDSQDLPGGDRNVQKTGEPNAIRELRTDSISETQPPGDIQKVGEEVRQGADEEGQTRQREKYQSGLGGEELEKIKDVLTSSSRLLLRNPEKLRFAPSKTGEYDGGQLVNRMLNTIPQTEKEMLVDAGIRERFPAGKKTTAKEVDKWIEENGPKVEVKKLEAVPSVSALEQKRAELEHKLDTLHPGWRTRGDVRVHQTWSNADRELYSEWESLEKGHPTTESATARYTMVNPKPLKEMPGAVDLLVRIPTKISPSELGYTQKPIQYQSSHYPTEGKNLLVHVRGYMEEQNGKKIFHVFEVQSDWAQALRKGKEYIQEDRPFTHMNVHRADVKRMEEPLLKKYETLALKAAIEHAKQNGADAIAISDAETAMMSEGHDYFTTPEREAIAEGERITLPQEKGMRLHYDEILPRIAKELTGSEGQRVDFGEHQNAMASQEDQSIGHVFRRDLVFKDPDGSKKVTITARMFPLIDVSEPPYSATSSKLYSGLGDIKPEDLKKAVRKGLNYASLKNPEGVPDFLFKISKKGEAEEITDQHELGRAIEQTGEKHYWVDSTGKLTQGKAPENTHYLSAKGILKEPVKDVEASDIRDTYKKMRDQGYAKVLEQPSGVYVVGRASEGQIRVAKELADKGGKDLYVGGVKYQPPPPPETKYYSGLPFLDTAKKLLDHITGAPVKRPFEETLDYYLHTAAVHTTPRTVAANERLGNLLVRATTADFAGRVEGLPAAQIQANVKTAKKQLRDAYLTTNDRNGRPLALNPVRGQSPPQGYTNPKIQAFPIWVRSDLAPELVQSFDPRTRLEHGAAFHYLMDLMVQAQIIGVTDFTFHTGNMMASIMLEQGKGGAVRDVLLNLPAVNFVDAVTRIGESYRQQMFNSQQVKGELVNLAKIGALREVDPTAGVMTRVIQSIDRAGRLARNRMFDNLVKRKLVPDSEVARREFVNKMGQYNERLMSATQAKLKNTLSPFVVAGKTFNYNALNNLLASPGARTANPGAYMQLKALKTVNALAAMVAVPIAANLLITGQPFGRKGTTPGAIDLGTNDEDGRPKQWDPLQMMLLRRGLRNTGMEAVIEGGMEEKSASETVGSAVHDIMMGIIRPFAGPVPRFIQTAATGDTLEGYNISNDPQSKMENMKAALKSANPMLQSWIEGRESGKSGTKNIVERLAGVVGYKKGKYPKHEDLLTQEQGKPVEGMDIGERLVAEAEHEETAKSKRESLPIDVRRAEELKAGQKAQKNIVKRGVELQESLDKADRQWLQSRGLLLQGYDNKVTLGKIKMYLTENEMARYTDLIKENTADAISALRDLYDDLDNPAKEKAFSAAMSAARKMAREQLELEIVKKNVPKNSRKRFSIFRSGSEEDEGQ